MFFSHLHVHSHYSLLDGLPKIPEIVQKAVDYKMPAVALTDHGAMYGIIEFYKACIDHGIKPLLGMEAYLSPYPLASKEAKTNSLRYHLILIAKNLSGYKNLLKLTTVGWLHGFYYKPRIDKKHLKKYSDGLILLSACASGEIPQTILKNDQDKAVALIREYQNIVGPKNFFLEIQDHPESEDYQKLKKITSQLARDLNIPLIATNDVHYLEIKNKTAQDALICIQTNKKLEQENRLTMTGSDYHFASPREMAKKFADLPEALTNTQLIVEQCNVELELGKWVFPSVEIPAGLETDEYLRKRAYDGIKKRLKLPIKTKSKPISAKITIPPTYQKRLDYELNIIKQKGYAPYFLVLADIVNFAKSQNIITTTRGSAAGSLVSYGIGITTADPMDFNLPFERFLNPYRPSPPDIDLDIEDARRGEVINYVRKQFGKEKVAHIITFGTLLARAAVRDVGRVMGLPYSFCDKVAKMIPIGSQGFRMTLERAMSENPNLKQAYLENEDLRRLIDLAKQIEGCVRHASLHAAGIVIAPTDLTEFTPLQKDSKQGEITTQYDMHAIEDAGLLKIDLLGITNLSVLGLAREIIKRTKNIEIDLYNLPLDDQKTFKLLASGQTMGVFQLSGSGMTRYLKELEPSTIFDIMAMISLYRPGPIESIPEFIRRKHNPNLVTYPHPKLKEILKTSYGVITYQDDVLLTAIELAGYNWKEADKLRKAIGKKIPKEMAAQHIKFVQGCVEHSGMTEPKAERIWKLIEPFAAYGFNKAHGSSYALVAYQTAYVKANFPVEFMAALLTCESGNLEKAAQGITECDALGIKVLPPDVNESLGGFTVVGTKTPLLSPLDKEGRKGSNIRFGLNVIKHLGSNVIDQIIDDRKTSGPYQNLEDFLTRLTLINKKSLEALIRSGAMDRFARRHVLNYNVEAMLNFAKLTHQEKESNKISLFGKKAFARRLKLKEPPKDYSYPILAFEKEYLGLYISSHPLEKFKPYFDKLNITSSQALKTKDNRSQLNSQPVKIIGIINTCKSIKTKKGDLMMFVTLEDLTSTLEVIVFPNLLKNTAPVWQNDNIVLIEGSISNKDEEVKIIADKARVVEKKDIKKMVKKLGRGILTPSQEDAQKVKRGEGHPPASSRKASPAGIPSPNTDAPQQFYITLPQKIAKNKLEQLKFLLKQHPGQTPVLLRIDADRVKILKTSVSVKISENLKKEVSAILDN
jgi:DNA polymerase-3 subunit alpha